MKKNFIVPVIVVALVLVGILLYLSYTKTNNANTLNQGNDNENNQENLVFIEDFSFGPEEIEINVGESVTWINRDSVGHTATSDSGEFDSSVLGNGQSFSFTFRDAGEFSYHCTPHPYMKGKIIVR